MIHTLNTYSKLSIIRPGLLEFEKKEDCTGPQFPSAIGWRKKSNSYNLKTTIWVSHKDYLNPYFKSFPTFWWYDLSYDFILKFSKLILQWETNFSLCILCSKPYLKHFI